MKAENWMFEDSPAAMALTTQGIITRKTQILTVWHNEYDGMWTFWDGENFDYSGLIQVELSEIVEIDRSTEGICSLPLGWAARRKDTESAWEMKPDTP